VNTLPLRALWKRRSLERRGSWTRARLEAHQAEHVTALRRFALERSPFYRRFHRGLEHAPLTDLPILTKSTMMENFDDLVTDRAIRLADVNGFLNSDPGLNLFRGRYVALATSGSTGLRGVFLFDEREWLAALANIARPMAWAGLKPSLLRPARTAMLASTTPWHYSSRVGLSLASRFIPTLRFDAAELIESMVSRLNQWRPEVLAVYPSVLRQLAEEQIAGRLRIPLRHVSTSAEVLTPATRQLVRQAWNINVYDTYGATEYAPIAAECSYGRKHLVEDGAVIEISGDRILLTIFDRYTQPLIRYEISDMVRAIEGDCECGRPFRLIEAVEGRQEDVLYFRSRNPRSSPIAVHPNSIHNLLETVPATGWQVLQEDEALYVCLNGLRDAGAAAAIERAFTDFLFSQGADPPPVRVTTTTSFRRGATGKAPLIIRAGVRAKAAAQTESS